MKVTYIDLIRDSHLLSQKITKSYDFVFGIPSGGIIVAFIISQQIKAQMMSVEDILNYKGDKTKILVVDDLVDSGTTLARYPGYDTAVLYKKPHSPTPTYYLQDIPLEWVLFPHEKDQIGIEEHMIRILEHFNLTPDRQKISKLSTLLNFVYKK